MRRGLLVSTPHDCLRAERGRVEWGGAAFLGGTPCPHGQRRVALQQSDEAGPACTAHTEAASASRTSMHADHTGDGEGEEEEPHCRYCFMGADEADKGALCSPCACSGSQAFVHLQCLQRWQSSTLLAAASNEVCGGSGAAIGHNPNHVVLHSLPSRI
jgi:hypothetical protein